MPSSTFATRVRFGLRAGGVLAVAALASSLTACAAEPALKFVAPTMAPEQSLVDACSVSGVELERLTAETEQQIRQGIEEAGAQLTNGELPSIDILSGPLNDALAEIEAQVSNSEILAAVGEVRVAMQGFQYIEKPESAIGVPGYLAALGSQASELARASSELQSLCTTS